MTRRWIGGAAAAAVALSAAAFTAPAIAEPKDPRPGKGADRAAKVTRGYEVWASDQSNSVAGAAGPGTKGSYLWIWDSKDIARQLDGGPEAPALGCADGEIGPCDLLDVFPQDLAEYDGDGNATGTALADSSGFGRLHGMLADPQQRYLTANIFAPGGGYVGIIDRRTKGAVALFRVTEAAFASSSNRSVHMSFWNNDGSQILVANLNGKILERIDVTRNGSGKIIDAVFDRSASLGVGKGQSVATEATVFLGSNQHGDPLIGRVAGDYADADFGDLTPNGVCKENDCEGEPAAAGGRPNNVIICPIPSDNGLAYITMGGGGLLVADTSTTPMSIVGEYGNQVINGAGCGGVQTGDSMWLNAGVSASPAGADWSTYTVYTLDDTAYGGGQPENEPAPALIFRDAGNTMKGGALSGPTSNETGQLPGITTRRDSHGAAVTGGGAYVHMVDRLQNVVESFAAESGERRTYDLANGVCAAHAAEGVPAAYADDPTPDLMETTPDGRYLMVGFRGPVPVSVSHSAQGACPGVGIVKLTGNGRSGKLVDVLRTTNTVDTVGPTAVNGYAYAGPERSDIHAATVVAKR